MFCRSSSSFFIRNAYGSERSSSCSNVISAFFFFISRNCFVSRFYSQKVQPKKKKKSENLGLIE